MKMISSRLCRRAVLAAMVSLAISHLSASPTSTNAPAAAAKPAAATKPAAAPAPAAPPVEVDKDTGKPIVTTPSGLKYVDIVVGTGADVKQGDHVAVNYVGKLIDGTKFDASADHGSTFPYVQGVSQLIAGWTEGTSTMKVGGKRKLIIPPQLGYGMQGAGDVIPPNSTLIFEIEMVSDADAKPTK